MGIASKWVKHRVLSIHPGIRKHLPETYLYRKESLFKLLGRHQIIYLKPVIGTSGNGIIRIKRQKNSFQVQKGYHIYTITQKSKLASLISRLTKGRRYLIQQGIHLISIQHRPLDYRLLILRPQRDWKTIGIMGKWAAPRKIVTNHCRGGKPINLCTSLVRSKGWSGGTCAQMEQRIYSLGKKVAHTLGNRYRLRQLGIDLGIDGRQRIWLIEVNTRPGYQLFRYHHNKSLYRIVRHNMKLIRGR